MLFPGSSGASGANLLLLLVAALALDAAVGEMPFLFRLVPHPVVLIGRAIAWFDRRLNRDTRSEAERRVRGVVTVILMIGGALAIGWVIAWFCRVVPSGWAVEIFVVAVLLAQRSLYDHVAAVLHGLETRGLAGGRAAVSHIVGRDPSSLDAHGVARAGIESLAENFSDGVVAPVVFYVLFGLPGLLAYKTANTMDSMIGHLSPRYRSFGWAAARLDDIANLLPARLAGLLVTLAAVSLPGAHAGAALKVMFRDAGKHRSPNAGWPEGAMAGALGLALAGPRRYAERVVEDPWIGDGRSRATPEDMGRALTLFVSACLAQVAVLLTLWLALRGLR